MLTLYNKVSVPLSANRANANRANANANANSNANANANLLMLLLMLMPTKCLFFDRKLLSLVPAIV